MSTLDQRLVNCPLSCLCLHLPCPPINQSSSDNARHRQDCRRYQRHHQADRSRQEEQLRTAPCLYRVPWSIHFSLSCFFAERARLNGQVVKGFNGQVVKGSAPSAGDLGSNRGRHLILFSFLKQKKRKTLALVVALPGAQHHRISDFSGCLHVSTLWLGEVASCDEFCLQSLSQCGRTFSCLSRYILRVAETSSSHGKTIINRNTVHAAMFNLTIGQQHPRNNNYQQEHCSCGNVQPNNWSTASTEEQISTGTLFMFVCWLVGCLTSQQHASVSQGRICTDNFTCCHTEIEVADPTFHCHAEIEVADPTFHLTQSQYTDTGPTSPSADPITPGAWQGSHWSAIV